MSHTVAYLGDEELDLFCLSTVPVTNISSKEKSSLNVVLYIYNFFFDQLQPQFCYLK